MITRREYLAAFGLAATACRTAKFAGTVEFAGEGSPPMNIVLGSELDGRLYTELSGLKSDSLITPVPDFYIRTCASKLLPPAKDWTIEVRGARRTHTVSAEDLIRAAKPLGPGLMECAGNTRGTHFGMISVAQWEGVPISTLLSEFNATGRVLVSGFDRYASESRTSTPGASWIFPVQDLLKSGAFLATKMDGAPLTADHGTPVRLVVPGWYGCSCIKWVNKIAAVDDRAEATSQMSEYAQRTHQNGVPKLAADYEAPKIDTAAMPIRIENWTTRYKIVGIVWGAPVRSLEIRFNQDQSYTAVDNFQPGKLPWSLWTHWWVPSAPGTYQITLRVPEAGVRTRRLDLGYYARTVQIT